jgi:FtsZ-binding cell division protein ZapB
MTVMDKKTKTIIIIVSCVCALAVAGIVALLVSMNHLRKENEEKEREIFNLNEQVAFEQSQAVLRFDDEHALDEQLQTFEHLKVDNDSLQQLLDQQTEHAKELVEEIKKLRKENTNDQARINELLKQLADVRELIMGYIRQIDELNAQNQVLTAENQQVKQENQQIRQQNTHLTTQNQQLTETVTRAKQLDITNFEMTPLNKRDKKTRYLRKTVKLQLDYTIGKNITAEPGMKTIYLRLTGPDDQLLGEQEGKVFDFEDGQVPYSLKQDIEYAGEVYHGTFYWPFSGEAREGSYRVEFFADGNQIGQYSFVLD